MSWKRTELILGLLTVSLASLATVILLKADYDDALRMKRPFQWSGALAAWTFLLLLPGLAVAIGTYIHAVRESNWGGAFIIVGGLILMWPFNVPYYLIDPFYTSQLAATSALMTIFVLYVSANANDP